MRTAMEWPAVRQRDVRKEAILTDIAHGYAYAAIAKRFGLARNTVKQYAYLHRDEIEEIRGDLWIVDRAQRIVAYKQILALLDADPGGPYPSLRNRVLRYIREEERKIGNPEYENYYDNESTEMN